MTFRRILVFALAMLTAATALSFSTKLTSASDIFFEPGAEATDATQRDALNKLINSRAAQPCALETMIIVGHADALETAPAKLIALSCRRANYVKDQLVRRGIPLERIYVEGLGATQPVDVSGSRKNRRVEIEAVGTSSSCPSLSNDTLPSGGSSCVDAP